jgi:outer membrane murein-binding lipoprotein Lpp
MDKITVVNIALGSVGVVSGVTGTIIGCVNSRSIKKMAPLESRMTAVESNINALLNPTTTVVAAAPAAPAPAAQPQQQAAPQNQQ